MALNVKPIGDRILVEPVEEKEVKKGGIIIPDTAKEKPQEGTIVALGTGKRDEDGKLIEWMDAGGKVADEGSVKAQNLYGKREITVKGWADQARERIEGNTKG